MTPTESTGLAVGLGALALAVAAAYLARGAIVARARPLMARAMRPALLRIAGRRPLRTARFLARHPQPAAKLIRALR